jgi:hypothetical protein
LPGQPHGDYSVHGDYNEYPQVLVFVGNLKLLRLPAVNALQLLLKDFPGWQIDLMVSPWDHLKDWPEMNLSIRSDEIVEDLQRQYFPKEFQDLAYENARPGKILD